MAVPDYESLMLPFLEEIKDGADYHIRTVRACLAQRLALTDEDLGVMLPSGSQPLFHSRVHWAKTYMQKAGVLEAPSRGVVHISDRGRGLLAEKLGRIDNGLLNRFPEFVEWKRLSQSGSRNARIEPAPPPEQELDSKSPEETLTAAHRTLRQALEDDLLERVRGGSWMFFQKVVLNVLEGLGYGGAGKIGYDLKRGPDGGVDGVIWEDKLGLDVIYVQAKRWEATVGRPEVQAFAGSLEGFRARKGVMMTPSTFSRDAQDYVDRIEKRIVLIDGPQLAQLMFEIGLGVSTKNVYEVKAIDSEDS